MMSFIDAIICTNGKIHEKFKAETNLEEALTFNHCWDFKINGFITSKVKQ